MSCCFRRVLIFGERFIGRGVGGHPQAADSQTGAGHTSAPKFRHVPYSKPDGSLYQNAQLIATVGERPLGVQTSQIISAAAYFADLYSVDRLKLITIGPRMGTAALCAAALDGEQQRFGTLTTENSPDSFKKFLQPAASYDTTPEIYYFGLLKWFDVPQLRELAAH